MEITNDILTSVAQRVEQTFLMQNIEKYVTEYTRIEDVEIMAICACWLNVGIRNEGMAYALWAYNRFKEDASPLDYVLNKSKNWTRYQQNYSQFTQQGHTLHSWWQLMGRLYKIYSNGGTILDEVIAGIREKESADVRDTTLEILAELFDGIKQMPTTLDYLPNKFVRFVMMMVRPRPIGTAVWSEREPEVFDATKTYIPLNSELLKAISDNALIENPTMTWEFGKTLHEYFSSVFPEDPARGFLSIIGLQSNIQNHI